MGAAAIVFIAAADQEEQGITPRATNELGHEFPRHIVKPVRIFQFDHGRLEQRFGHKHVGHRRQPVLIPAPRIQLLPKRTGHLNTDHGRQNTFRPGNLPAHCLRLRVAIIGEIVL